MVTHQEIKLKEGHKVTLKNKYNYNLYVFNGSVKGKEGYFVKLDKQTFGPFFKVIKEKTKPDEDVFLICMADAVNGYIVRIGIKGFEVVDKLDFSKEIAKGIDNLVVSEKGPQNVTKLGTVDKYAVYKTEDGKLFVELKGAPIKPVSQYELFDSFIEIHLHYLIEHNDNSFFDNKTNLGNYGPKVFRDINGRSRQMADLDYDKLGRVTRASSVEIAKQVQAIINELKARYTIEELNSFNLTVTRTGSFVDVKKLDRITKVEDCIMKLYDHRFIIRDNMIKKFIKNATNKLPTTIISIFSDKPRLHLIWDGEKLKDISDQLWPKELAYKRVEPKVTKYIEKVNKNIEKLESEFTQYEWDLLDFYYLADKVSHIDKTATDEGIQSYVKGKNIEQIIEKVRSLPWNEEDFTYSSRDNELRDYYDLLSTQKTFVKATNYFIEMLKAKYPVETNAILGRRESGYRGLVYRGPMQTFMDTLFAGIPTQKLLDKDYNKTPTTTENAVNKK